MDVFIPTAYSYPRFPADQWSWNADMPCQHRHKTGHTPMLSEQWLWLRCLGIRISGWLFWRRQGVSWSFLWRTGAQIGYLWKRRISIRNRKKQSCRGIYLTKLCIQYLVHRIKYIFYTFRIHFFRDLWWLYYFGFSHSLFFDRTMVICWTVEYVHHYSDVVMSPVASQITDVPIVCSTVCSLRTHNAIMTQW